MSINVPLFNFPHHLLLFKKKALLLMLVKGLKSFKSDIPIPAENSFHTYNKRTDFVF